MKKRINLQRKFACVLTVTEPNYPDILYPIEALDSLLSLQQQD